MSFNSSQVQINLDLNHLGRSPTIVAHVNHLTFFTNSYMVTIRYMGHNGKL